QERQRLHRDPDEHRRPGPDPVVGEESVEDPPPEQRQPDQQNQRRGEGERGPGGLLLRLLRDVDRRAHGRNPDTTQRVRTTTRSTREMKISVIPVNTRVAGWRVWMPTW